MLEKKRILIVDDDAEIRDLLEFDISSSGYFVDTASDGMEGLNKALNNKYDLILLDVMMPKMNGWQVCREIRKYSKVPIIMLTAKSSEDDELTGFECGADEYISKPFSPKILVARVDALLRRTAKSDKNGIMRAGTIELNKVAHIVKVNDREVELSFKEFELLVYFMENKNIALSREQILNNVWNYDYFGDARTIDTHVKKLRAKLTKEADYIKTIWGMGYKFEVEEN